MRFSRYKCVNNESLMNRFTSLNEAFAEYCKQKQMNANQLRKFLIESDKLSVTLQINANNVISISRNK